MLDKTKTEAKPKTTIIVIHETILHAFIIDGITYLLAVALIGTGWFLGSTAMQWVGFLVLAIMALMVVSKDNRGLTIEEARKRLDEIEQEING